MHVSDLKLIACLKQELGASDRFADGNLQKTRVALD